MTKAQALELANKRLIAGEILTYTEQDGDVYEFLPCGSWRITYQRA
jgi:hypothetical protein